MLRVHTEQRWFVGVLARHARFVVPGVCLTLRVLVPMCVMMMMKMMRLMRKGDDSFGVGDDDEVVAMFT